MAQTHLDSDIPSEATIREAFMTTLEERAAKLVRDGATMVASDGEELVAWQAHGVDVAKLPDDPQNILRISIGGGAVPVPLNYCRFRGDHAHCVDLLRTVLKAMEAGDT